MPSSVNILINAKDKASKPLNDVSKASTNMTSGLKGMIGPIAAVAAGFLAWKSITGILKGGAAAFAVQEKAVRDLSKTLGLFGDETEDTMDDLTSFAGELQMLTNVGDEVSLGLMKQARLMGVQKDELKGMTQASVALSEITGKSLKGSLEALAKAREGDFNALAKAIPQLKTMTDHGEKQALVNEMLAKSFAVAGNGTKDMEGAMTSMGNNWGDILETIGSLIGPFVTNIADWFNRIAPLIQGGISSLLPTMEIVAAKVSGFFRFTFDTGVKVYTALEAVISNFGDSMKLVWTVAKLGLIAYWEELKFHFTVRIPSIIKWLVDNWQTLFADMFNFVKTLLVNAVTSYINIFKKFWSWVSSGFKGGISEITGAIGEEMGKNMLDGFEAQTKSLPENMIRSMTDGEAKLIMEADRLASGIGNAYGEKLKERQGFFNDLFDGELGTGAKEFLGFTAKDLTKLKAGAKDKAVPGAKAEKGVGTTSAEVSRFLTGGSGVNDIEQDKLDAAKKTAEQTVILTTVMTEAKTLWEKMVASLAGGDSDVEVLQSKRS